MTAIPTDGPRSAATIARECIEKGAELILAAGGDGTINEVANGMIGNAIPLGILPGGTANVLATELGVGRGMPQAAAGLASLTPAAYCRRPNRERPRGAALSHDGRRGLGRNDRL